MGISKLSNGGTMVREETLTQLTAPGSSSAINVEQFQNHTFQVKVASINTNVVIRMQGSLDGTNWYNIDDSGNDTTLTSNGVTQYNKKNFKTKYVRFTFVSESGGTAATIDVKYMGGN